MSEASVQVYYNEAERIIFIEYPNANILTEELFTEALDGVAKIPRFRTKLARRLF